MSKDIAKYILSPDLDKVERIKSALVQKSLKYGKSYCPCVPPRSHNDDTVCPCKTYRETGVCHCGLYIS